VAALAARAFVAAAEGFGPSFLPVLLNKEINPGVGLYFVTGLFDTWFRPILEI
jgi:hypothetical protein